MTSVVRTGALVLFCLVMAATAFSPALQSRAQADEPKINTNRLADLAKRLSSFGDAIKKEPNGAVIKEWVETLEKVTGEEVKRAPFVFFVASLDSLFKDNEYLPDAAKQQATRSKQITKETLLEWQQALKLASKREPSKVNVVVLIAQQDRLFKEGQFKQDVSKKLLGRLGKVPADSVTAVSKATGLDQNQACILLVGMDGLWKVDQFQQAVFDKVLKEAQGKNTGP